MRRARLHREEPKTIVRTTVIHAVEVDPMEMQVQLESRRPREPATTQVVSGLLTATSPPQPARCQHDRRPARRDRPAPAGAAAIVLDDDTR